MIATYYQISDGKIVGSYAGPESGILPNTPSGCAHHMMDADEGGGVGTATHVIDGALTYMADASIDRDLSATALLSSIDLASIRAMREAILEIAAKVGVSSERLKQLEKLSRGAREVKKNGTKDN
jgi:hypothetical protein